jgi:hypothetical protein
VAAIATLLLTCMRVYCHAAATGSMKIKPMVQVLANLKDSF